MPNDDKPPYNDDVTIDNNDVDGGPSAVDHTDDVDSQDVSDDLDEFMQDEDDIVEPKKDRKKLLLILGVVCFIAAVALASWKFLFPDDDYYNASVNSPYNSADGNAPAPIPSGMSDRDTLPVQPFVEDDGTTNDIDAADMAANAGIDELAIEADIDEDTVSNSNESTDTLEEVAAEAAVDDLIADQPVLPGDLDEDSDAAFDDTITTGDDIDFVSPTPAPIMPDPIPLDNADVAPMPDNGDLTPVEDVAVDPVIDPSTLPISGTVSGSPDMTAAGDIVDQAVSQQRLTPSQIMERAVVERPNPKKLVVVKKNRAATSDRALLSAANRTMANGNYNAALDMYSELLSVNPEDSAALYGKAQSLQRLNYHQEALELYETLLAVDPNNVVAMTNYLGLLRTQAPDVALDRLHALEQQNPSSAEIAGQLGMAYSGMDDTITATRYFRKAAAIDPDNPVYPYNLAVLADRMGTVSLALDNYREALYLNSKMADPIVPSAVINNRINVLAAQ